MKEFVHCSSGRLKGSDCNEIRRAIAANVIEVWNCVEIFGLATETIVRSIGTRKPPKKGENNLMASLSFAGYSVEISVFRFIV